MDSRARRDEKRGVGGEQVGGRRAEAEFAEEREEAEGAGEKADELAGPPLPPVGGVASPSAAQDTHGYCGRYKAGD